jgi:hypothetical protein
LAWWADKMAASIGLVSVIGLTLVAIGFAAAGANLVLRTLLWAQCLYWTFSYVLRPVVLLAVEPEPRLADSVADPRIAAGGYERALPSVLSPVAFGLLCYLILAAVVIRSIPSARRSPESPAGSSPGRSLTFATSLVVGWVARSVVTHGVGGNVAVTLGGLATIGALGLIVFYRGTARASAAILILAGASELAWSVLSTSKTPALAAVLAMVIRLGLIGWTRRSAALGAGFAISVIVIFPVLQALKLDSTTSQVVAAADASYPVYIRPFMAIIRRFDLLSAATDARLYGDGRWMTTSEYWSRLFNNLIPQQVLGSEKIGAGTLWATSVRAQSLRVSNPDVSLADGFIAEGYVVNGFLGVAAAGTFILLVALAVSRGLMARNIFLQAISLYLISSSCLFERGVFGVTEEAGKAIQVGALVWLIGLFARALVGHSAQRREDLRAGRGRHGLSDA